MVCKARKLAKIPYSASKKKPYFAFPSYSHEQDPPGQPLAHRTRPRWAAAPARP